MSKQNQTIKMNKKIHIEVLDLELQEQIFDSINNEFWDLIYYNPQTKGVRYYDRDSQARLNENWLEVII